MAVSVVMFTRNGAAVTFLSSDTKPTTGIGIVSGCIGIETDTGLFYKFDGSSTWDLIGTDYPARVETPTAENNWQRPGWWADGQFNRTHSADALYYTPIFVARKTTFDRVGIDVTSGTGDGEVCRLGLYEADPDTLMPAARVSDFGTVLVGSVAEVEITISLTLERGYYWTAHISNGGPQLGCVDGNSGVSIPLQGWHRAINMFAQDALIRFIENQTGVATGGLADPATVPDLNATLSFAAPQLRVTSP